MQRIFMAGRIECAKTLGLGAIWHTIGDQCGKVMTEVHRVGKIKSGRRGQVIKCLLRSELPPTSLIEGNHLGLY